MIFETNRHEPLIGGDWNSDLVRETIRSIATDCQNARIADGYWPAHPLDVEDDSIPINGYKCMYLGSAGVIWALWYLQKEGAAELDFDPCTAIEQADRDYQAHPDTGEVVPSFYLGEVGIRLVKWRLAGSTETADQLYAAVAQNITNPTNEALWAAPGTMLAAWYLWQATREERWRDLYAQNIEQLWRTWLPVASGDFHLWTQDLYGHVVQLLGAGHGFAGSIYPLLRGATLLDDARREQLYERCVDTLRATAVVEDGCTNWPQGIGTPRPGRTNMLMQWCHGAPGVITSLTHYPRNRSGELETMLLSAGEAVWKAGPLSKGYGLCHGTAGNGYAFLKLYRRTGDQSWLERARAFAMHAIVQRDRMRKEFGVGRYTLWTGEPGLAVFLWHCIVGADGVPLIDVLD